MFDFLRRDADAPRLEGRLVRLRTPLASDFGEWRALRGDSRTFLEPWEPEWAADELSAKAYRARLRIWKNEIAAGVTHPFFIFERAGGNLAGGISVFNIRYGAAESGQIGYWMGERHAGMGYMSESLGLVAAFCFGTLGLRRVEAACIPDNRRSAHVLEKAGFEREGLVRSYLRINGARRDHHLYALLAPPRVGE